MFVLRNDIGDLTPENLTRIDGAHGPFFIAWAGLHLAAEFYYFYGDSSHQFFFYVRTARTDSGRTIEVYEATNGRLTGGKPDISSQDAANISDNITQLFRECNFTSPSKPVDAAEVPTRISFTWGLGQ